MSFQELENSAYYLETAIKELNINPNDKSDLLNKLYDIWYTIEKMKNEESEFSYEEVYREIYDLIDEYIFTPVHPMDKSLRIFVERLANLLEGKAPFDDINIDSTKVIYSLTQ